MLVATDISHGEATLRDHLVEGNSSATVAKVFSRRSDGSPVLLRQFFVVEDRFEQPLDGSKLRGRKTIDEFVHVLPRIAHQALPTFSLSKNAILCAHFARRNLFEKCARRTWLPLPLSVIPT
jgi:hypothetical protein